jgi:hypothetical protein
VNFHSVVCSSGVVVVLIIIILDISSIIKYINSINYFIV